MRKPVYSANGEDRRRIVNQLAAAIAANPNITFAYLYGTLSTWT
jgi:hypothetical protein